MTSSQSADERCSIDPSEPFRGVVVCCTSIPPDQRTEIANKVQELGGIHKYDLTPDVTHLVVGDYDTPKYRHVARERSDIKPMDAVWIDAVAELWKRDEEIDFFALEREHQLKALEKCGIEAASSRDGISASRQSLLICLTGFGEQRDEIADKITANGGRYTGDLTRRCSHLVVSKPEGKKFTAAKSWGVYTVTLDWLDKSVERGMILEEAKFDPLLPIEEQGIGAWIKKEHTRAPLGKRSRSATSNGTEERGGRKLRKTASMKLNSQRNNLWGDILGRSGSREYSFANDEKPSVLNPATPEPTIQDAIQHQQHEAHQNEGVFANCIFAIHGFNNKRQTVLEDTIATLGGSVASSLRDAATSLSQTKDPYRFLVVPQTSQPDTHPNIAYDNVGTVTEFFIERCLHHKQFTHPSEQVLGRPFPLFPIPGFSDLVVCTAAFTGLELNQVARSLQQLGAKFEEEFRRTTSVLVCRSLQAMRKDKLRYALEWNVPVVSPDWMWECISTGFNVPLDRYIYPELRSRYLTRPSATTDKKQPAPTAKIKSEAKDTQPRSAPKPKVAQPSGSRPRIIGGFDASAFEDDSPERPQDTPATVTRAVLRAASSISAEFQTARSQPVNPLAKEAIPPLAETTSTRLNKSPSPPKSAAPSLRTRSDPYPADSNEKQPNVLGRAPSAPATDPSNTNGTRVQGRTNYDTNPTITEEAEVEAEKQEAARQFAKSVERQALSSKLSSLIQPAVDASVNDRDSHTQAPPARVRRRQILGRAISNVSNGSSAASADGSGPAHRQHIDSVRAATATVTASTEDDDADDRGVPPPPATQLEYLDPRAQEIKKALMNKMMGVDGTDAQVASAPTPTVVENTTLGVGVRSLRKR